MEKRKNQRKNKAAQEETRIRVCEYLRKKAGTQKQAAELFAITERAVNKIWGIYKQEGKRGLVSKKRGVKGGEKDKWVASSRNKKVDKRKTA